MSRSSVLFLAFLALPLCVVSIAAHRLVSAEVARGRIVGRAYLQAQAQVVAAKMQSFVKAEVPTEDAALPVLVGIVDNGGTVRSGTLPDDGRCFGLAPLAPKFPGLAVKVMWPGEESPGLQRARRLRCVELSVFGGSAALFLLAAGFLVRRHLNLRRELQEQRAVVRDFSHRLKTPITSISLCAELARDGRVSEERKRECAETIFAEATKLDRIVGEVLNHIEGGRHG